MFDFSLKEIGILESPKAQGTYDTGQVIKP